MSARRAGRAAGTGAGLAPALVLAALIAGIPAALYLAGGSPVPHALPSWHQVTATLTRPDDGTLFLAAVRYVSWLAWAAFTICAVVEVFSRARGRPAPRLPVIAPLQAFAAVLIGAVVLTALPLPHGPRPFTPRVPPPSRAAATAPARPGRSPHAGGVAVLTQAGSRHTGHRHGGAAGRPGAQRPRIHRVVAGDNLWDIAARYLRNPERWHEIYHLNRGRPQPGGGALTNPGDIYPGWLLLLPAPGGHQHAPAPRQPSPPRHPRPGPPSAPAPAMSPRPSPPAVPGPPRPARQPGAELPSEAFVGLSLAAAVSAAVVLARVQRRRRYRPAQVPTSSLRPGEPLPPVIAALRRAAHPEGHGPAGGPHPAAAGPGRGDPDDGDPYPDPYGPGPGPGRHRAGAPGISPGTRPPGTAPGLPGASRPPGPGTIILGARDGNEVAADVASLGGLGLTGPGAAGAASAILAGLLSRALPGQPGAPAGVIMPAADAQILLPARAARHGTAGMLGLSVPASLNAALDELETVVLRRARTSGTLTAGDEPPAAAWPGPPAVLIATPDRAAGPRLRGILETGRAAGVTAILLGDWPPGVTCQVAADGVITSVTTPGSGLDGIRLFHLAGPDTMAVISLLQEARGIPAARQHGPPAPGSPPPSRPPSQPATSGILLPAPLAGSSQETGTAPAGPPPGTRAPVGGPGPAGPRLPGGPLAPGGPLPAPAAGRHPGAGVPAAAPARGEPWPGGGARPAWRAGSAPGDQARPAVRVDVLGPLRISAAGGEIRGGLRKARELLAFLAVHPGGATGGEISEALWPESAPGYGTSQRNLALRKLRDLLRAATGLTGPMFVILAAGRYRLDPALAGADVWDFQAALDEAHRAPGDAARLAAWRKAAALYRGPLADGAGYDWAEPYAEAARRRALDAWTRIAELIWPADPEQALAALETALGHDPFNEYLYQRIMRLQAAAGRPDAVRRTLRLLETRLAELGLTPAAQTCQVAAALLGTGGPPPPAGPRPAPPPRRAPPGHRRTR
jgi:DNA-binding SARP family transcriptional activator